MLAKIRRREAGCVSQALPEGPLDTGHGKRKQHRRFCATLRDALRQPPRHSLVVWLRRGRRGGQCGRATDGAKGISRLAAPHFSRTLATVVASAEETPYPQSWRQLRKRLSRRAARWMLLAETGLMSPGVCGGCVMGTLLVAVSHNSSHRPDWARSRRLWRSCGRACGAKRSAVSARRGEHRRSFGHMRKAASAASR
eukprot:4536864-Amphidinium_carterae.1